MSDSWSLKDKEAMMILLPIDGGKYVVAKAIIDLNPDRKIECISDAVISLASQDGIKPKVKFPFVFIHDIDVLRRKLIKDIENLEATYNHSLSETNGIEGYLSGFDDIRSRVKIIIDKRFGVD